MTTTSSNADSWLTRFHAGERSTMEECYREHAAAVMQAVGTVLEGADRETVTHEVFFRLLSDPSMRASFGGGSLGNWLRTVARHQAIDYVRKHYRETQVEPQAVATLVGSAPSSVEHQVELRMLVDRFCREQVPDKWAGVFEARFVKQLSQREAARALGMHRTTLAYQEQRLRRRLRRFLLRRREA